MQFRFASIFLIASAIGAYAQLQINTPTNVVQCLPQLLTWSGGSPPYFLSVLPGGQPSAAALVTFPETNATSVTWTVNIPAGTSIGLTLRDSTGTIAQSAPFTVGSSDNSACVSSSLSVAPGSSTAGGATTTGGSATTTGTSSGSATTRTSASGTGSSTSAASSGAQSSNAAVPFADIGSAGVIGALVAAILA